MSWQNFMLSTLLRLRFKPMAKKNLDVATIRANAAKPIFPVRQPEGWRVRPVAAGGLKGEWIEPESAAPPPRTIFYLHGGGYFFCTPATHRPITYTLGTAAEARVFSLDYRLAPEHPFPAAVHDAVAGYRALLEHGVTAERMVIAGDSAGGGLALATMLSVREAGLPLPAGAVLFSPWTDLAATGESLRSNTKRDCMFHGEGIAKGARIYLCDAPGDHPLASPLYADLQGLPPLLIQVSDSEVLLDDSRRLAAKAQQAGVAVSLETWRRLPHVWQIFHPFLPEARRALADAAAFARRVTS